MSLVLSQHHLQDLERSLEVDPCWLVIIKGVLDHLDSEPATTVANVTQRDLFEPHGLALCLDGQHFTVSNLELVAERLRELEL